MLCVPTSAAVKYVRPIGYGDSTGSNYTNAMSWRNKSFSAGDTIYIAGEGITTKYASATVTQDSIVILKTTSAQSGVTGYTSVFADSQAVFAAPLIWQASNSVLDGMVGSDSTRSTYGIIIDPVLPQTGNIKGLAIPQTYGGVTIKVTDDIFRHVYIRMTGDTEDGQLYGSGCVYIAPHEDYYAENIRFEDCYFGYGIGTNWLISNFQGINGLRCMFSDNYSTPTWHGEQISTQNLYAYACTLNACTFVQSQTYIVGWHGNEDGSTPNQNWVITNCIGYKSKGQLTFGFGVGDSGQPNLVKNAHLVNNTFIDIEFGAGGSLEPGTIDAENIESYKSYSRNNLYYNCDSPESYGFMTAGTVDDDYNGYFKCTGIDTLRAHDVLKSTDPFTNSAGLDFSLASTSQAIAKGDSTGIVSVIPYNTDAVGTTRPAGLEAYPDLGFLETATSPSSSTISDTLTVLSDSYFRRGAGWYTSSTDAPYQMVRAGNYNTTTNVMEFSFIMPGGITGATFSSVIFRGYTTENKSALRKFKVFLQDGWSAVTDSTSFKIALADSIGSIPWTPPSAFVTGTWCETADIVSLMNLLQPSDGDTVRIVIDDNGSGGYEQWYVNSTESDSTQYRAQLLITYETSSITVDYPNGGESLEPGQIAYFAASSAGVDTVISYFSTNNGATWAAVDTFAVADSPVSWTVPDVNSDSCLVCIKDLADTTVADTSDAIFTIKEAPVVTSPDGGETWTVGTSQDITYNPGDAVNIKIEWSHNNGVDWVTIVASEAASGTHAWTVPDSTTTEAFVRVSDAGNTAYNDESDVVFTIIKNTVDLTEPDGAEELIVGETFNIVFTSSGIDSLLVILSKGGVESVQETLTVISSPYVWTVPDDSTNVAKIILRDLEDATVADSSVNVFSIIHPVLIVTLPNGGESIPAGSTYEITYNHYDVTNVKIEWSPNNSNNWITLVESETADGTFNWSVPTDSTTTFGLIRVTDSEHIIHFDISDSVFSILTSDVSDGTFTIIASTSNVTRNQINPIYIMINGYIPPIVKP